MGSSSSTSNGVVAGPFIGDPVTCLEICTANQVRGDILIGQAGGQLRMYSTKVQGSTKTEEELMESGYEPDTHIHTRFRAQAPLPRTDGQLNYTSDHSVLSIIRDDNVHAIMGAYSNGTRVYAVARTMGGRVVPLRGNTDMDHEEQYKFTVQDRYASRQSTYILQHQTNFVCLSSGRDGVSIDGTTGYEVDVRQPFDGSTKQRNSRNNNNSVEDSDSGNDSSPYEYGMEIEKGDIPVFFDGEYLVIMKTRVKQTNEYEDVDPTQKERSVTVYGGWGREEEVGDKSAKAKGGDAGNAAEQGEKTRDIQINLDDSTGSIAESEVDPREYDPTEGVYVVAELMFDMPPNRPVWGFTLSHKYIASVHQDVRIELWNLFDANNNCLVEKCQQTGPAHVLTHASRIHSYDQVNSESGDIVSICEGGTVYLWRKLVGCWCACSSVCVCKILTFEFLYSVLFLMIDFLIF